MTIYSANDSFPSMLGLDGDQAIQRSAAGSNGLARAILTKAQSHTFEAAAQRPWREMVVRLQATSDPHNKRSELSQWK